MGKGGLGHWLHRNVGNIPVLNHEGEPVDITEAESESKNVMRSFLQRRRETNLHQQMLITVSPRAVFIYSLYISLVARIEKINKTGCF